MSGVITLKFAILIFEIIIIPYSGISIIFASAIPAFIEINDIKIWIKPPITIIPITKLSNKLVIKKPNPALLKYSDIIGAMIIWAEIDTDIIEIIFSHFLCILK